jgi:opacity protein-like surface antigen
MKKLFIFTMIMIFSVSALSAIEITAFGGYNLYLEDVADAESQTKGGIGGGVRLGYDLPLITIGIMAEYLPILYSKVKFPSIGPTAAYYLETDLSTIPMMAFARTGFGPLPFYAIGGAGLYYNSTTLTSTPVNGKNITEISDSTTEFGVAIGGGLEMSLPLLTLEAGVLYHMIMAETSINMVTITAGVTLSI